MFSLNRVRDPTFTMLLRASHLHFIAADEINITLQFQTEILFKHYMASSHCVRDCSGKPTGRLFRRTRTWNV